MSKSIRQRLQVFVRFALDLAKLSKCTDRGVAAIVCDADYSQIFSIGINGGPKGGLDCLCTLGGKYTCAHAEINALAKATTSCVDKIMICTLSPCVTCATIIVNSGISKFIYVEQYKNTDGLDILRAAGVHVLRIPEKLLQTKEDNNDTTV